MWASPGPATKKYLQIEIGRNADLFFYALSLYPRRIGSSAIRMIRSLIVLCTDHLVYAIIVISFVSLL